MKIHALSTGQVEIKSKQAHAQEGGRLSRLATVFGDKHWSGWLPIHIWVIEHPEGVIVIDAGDTAAPPQGLMHPFNALAVHKRIRVEEEAGPQLAQLGIQPRDVRWLVLTHLHVDHDGGLGYFPNAQTVVARGEHQQASGVRGRLQGYYPQRWPRGWTPTLTDLEPIPFGPFARSQRLTKAGDVTLVSTPGHTSDHLSVVVHDGAHSLFFAGDASYTQHQMLEGWPDGVGPSEREQLETLGRIRRFAAAHATVYLPTHDPDASRRLEQRETTGLERGTVVNPVNARGLSALGG